MRIKTDPVSETLCSLEYQMMDKVQKPSNPEEIFCFYGTERFSFILKKFKKSIWLNFVS
jgi:hypothetical protein